MDIFSTVFPYLLIFVILPVICAILGLPFGVFCSVMGRQKCALYPQKGPAPFTKFDLPENVTDNTSLLSCTARDGVTLYGEFHDIKSEKTALLFHGYRSHPLKDFSEIAQNLISHGFNVLLVYQRAHGVSGGNHCGGGQLEKYDVFSWLGTLSAIRPQEYLIYGISMGGATVAFASPELNGPNVKVLVIDSAFSSFYDMMSENSANHPLFYRFAMGAVCTLCKRIGHFDIRPRTSDALKKNNIPALFIYGQGDKTVSQSQVDDEYSANASEKLMLTHPTAGHGKAFAEGQSVLENDFYSFVNRFI